MHAFAPGGVGEGGVRFWVPLDRLVGADPAVGWPRSSADLDPLARRLAAVDKEGERLLRRAAGGGPACGTTARLAG
jgi:hypothetical protein